MRLLPTGLQNRLRDRVDRAAEGSEIPAGLEGLERPVKTRPGSRERGRMRRRLRELRRVREAGLIELGALVLEAHRHGRDDSPVVKSKAGELAAIDSEARGIAETLGEDGGLDTVVAAGVAGACEACSALVSTRANYCSNCGRPLDENAFAREQEAAAQREAEKLVAAEAAAYAEDEAPPAYVTEDELAAEQAEAAPETSTNGDGTPTERLTTPSAGNQ